MLHGWVPAHSMSWAKARASSGEQYVARPCEYQVPGMSAVMIAYPCGTRYAGSGASNVVICEVCSGRTPLRGYRIPIGAGLCLPYGDHAISGAAGSCVSGR